MNRSGNLVRQKALSRQEIVKHLMPLNAMEQACREFHLSENKALSTTVQSVDSLRKILSLSDKGRKSFKDKFIWDNLMSSRLLEDYFIDAKSDVAIMKHLRYLPPFLHSHDFIEVIYVFMGSCNYSTGHLDFEMTGGDVCLVAPGVEHTISVFDDRSIILNLLVRRSTFDTAFFDLIAEDDILSDFFTRILYGNTNKNPYIIFKTGSDLSIQNIIVDMLREYESSETYKKRAINILLMLFFTLLLRNHEKNLSVINPEINQPDDNIILALRYIENNFNTVTLPQVAKFFNYSEAHFSRMIKDYTGRTFSDIIREIRVKKAAELTLNPTLSINEIVERVGYSDVSHFYRNFKHYFGMTPIEYRNQIKT